MFYYIRPIPIVNLEVQDHSKSNFPDLFETCSGLVRDLFGTCSGLVRDLFGTCSGLVRDLFETCSGLVWDLFGTCSGLAIKGLTTVCPDSSFVFSFYFSLKD